MTINKRISKTRPKYDIQLSFGEVGFRLDEHQYRDTISLIEMYHFYVRQVQVMYIGPRSIRAINNLRSTENTGPRKKYSLKTAPKHDFALLWMQSVTVFMSITRRGHGNISPSDANDAFVTSSSTRSDLQVHTRQRYVGSSQSSVASVLRYLSQELEEIDSLERKLSYEDIRSYRSRAASELARDKGLRRRLLDDKNKREAQNQGWVGWLLGTGTTQQPEEEWDPERDGAPTQAMWEELTGDPNFGKPEEEFEIEADDPSGALPRNLLQLTAGAHLNKGTFSLQLDPCGTPKDILSIVFENFRATGIQRPDNIEASVALGNFSVYDYTAPGTLYSQIVQVKDVQSDEKAITSKSGSEDESFFFFKFEKNPLDERADNAVTLRLRPMEIVYNRGYIEAIYKFFKPPASQLESVEALLVRSLLFVHLCYSDPV